MLIYITTLLKVQLQHWQSRWNRKNNFYFFFKVLFVISEENSGKDNSQWTTVKIWPIIELQKKQWHLINCRGHCAYRLCKWGCASGVMGEGGTWWYLKWPGSPLLRWRFPLHRHHSPCILSNGLSVLFLDCYGACAFHLKEGGIVELNMSLPFWQSKLGQAGSRCSPLNSRKTGIKPDKSAWNLIFLSSGFYYMNA